MVCASGGHLSKAVTLGQDGEMSLEGNRADFPFVLKKPQQLENCFSKTIGMPMPLDLCSGHPQAPHGPQLEECFQLDLRLCELLLKVCAGASVLTLAS